MNNPVAHDMDVLVLAPFGKDSALISKVVWESGIKARIVANVGQLVAAIPHDAAAAIIAEEALNDEVIRELKAKLDSQSPWSDLPIIVLTGGGLSTAATEVAVRSHARLGNVTLLERPLRAATMISVVRSAVAARRRQYEIRDHLHERKQAEEALRSARDALESIVEERTAALRRLSAQLLRVQDEERRRIARELHDSLGQYLAAIKMNLDVLALTRQTDGEAFDEVQQLLDRSIAETRTLSHLLHPPSLDTAGFASAATWYVEGFAKRGGIKAALHLPDKLSRLSESVEIALFRIMQEALTNVHRHSRSQEVEIKLATEDGLATLTITDFGKGIPQEVLDGFSHSGTNVGVGLAGIRERAKELNGTFDLRSSEAGTTLTVSIPVSGNPENVLAADPASQIYSSFAS